VRRHTYKHVTESGGFVAAMHAGISCTLFRMEGPQTQELTEHANTSPASRPQDE
jgi:hypothetical protein